MAEIKSSRAILAELPEAAVRFAADTWGASWCYNEAGSLVEFASLAHPDTPPPSGDVPKGITSPPDLIQAAREAAAQVVEEKKLPGFSGDPEALRRGEKDLWLVVQAAKRALDNTALRALQTTPQGEQGSRGDGRWALTIARRIAGASVEDIAEALRQADACGYWRGLEAGEKGRRGDAPAGWVLVPREPTEAMLDAAVKGSAADVSYADVEELWPAMLSAAPTPDANSGGEAPGRGPERRHFDGWMVYAWATTGGRVAWEIMRKADGCQAGGNSDGWTAAHVAAEAEARRLDALSAAPQPSQEKGEADA